MVSLNGYATLNNYLIRQWAPRAELHKHPCFPPRSGDYGGQHQDISWQLLRILSPWYFRSESVYIVLAAKLAWKDVPNQGLRFCLHVFPRPLGLCWFPMPLYIHELRQGPPHSNFKQHTAYTVNIEEAWILNQRLFDLLRVLILVKSDFSCLSGSGPTHVLFPHFLVVYTRVAEPHQKGLGIVESRCRGGSAGTNFWWSREKHDRPRPNISRGKNQRWVRTGM